MTVTQFENANILDIASIEILKKRIQAFEDPLRFLVFKYKEGTKDVLELIGQGNTGYEDFEKYFVEDQMVFVVWRTVAGDDVSSRMKFVFLHWVGNKVKSIVKVTSQAHGRSLRNFFGYFHLTINGRDKDEMNKDLIEEKIVRAGGVRYDNTENFDGSQKVLSNHVKTETK